MVDSEARSCGWLGRISRNRSTRRWPLGVFAVVAWFAILGFAAISFATLLGTSGFTQPSQPQREACQRPTSGSAIQEPQDLRSHDGVLQVDLAIYNSRQPDGSTRYCYLTPEGEMSPTLRVKPGDLLIVRFKNDLTELAPARPAADQPQALPFPAPLCV